MCYDALCSSHKLSLLLQDIAAGLPDLRKYRNHCVKVINCYINDRKRRLCVKFVDKELQNQNVTLTSC